MRGSTCYGDISVPSPNGHVWPRVGLWAEDGQSAALCHPFLLIRPAPAVDDLNELHKMQSTWAFRFFKFTPFQKISRKNSHFQTQPLHFHVRTPSVNVSLLPVEFKDSLQDWDSSQTVTRGMYGPKLSNQSLYHAICLFKSHWEAQSWNLRHCKTYHRI